MPSGVYKHKPHLKETRDKISNALKGKIKLPEHRKRLSESKRGGKNPLFGKSRSEETKNKIRAANRISCRTQEFRDSIRERVSGEKNPQFGKALSEETKLKISNSLKEYYQIPGSKEKVIKSCTGRVQPESMKLKLSEMRKGDKNPCWKGGHAYEPYCILFNKEFKERVRNFFDNTCVLCGKPQSERLRKLCIHHVIYNKNACCDDSERLFVPLCGSCHGKTNKDRDYWQEYFTKEINEKYGGKCYLTKEEYLQVKRIMTEIKQ